MARRTKEAFLWIIEILKKHKIPFQISGGMAARTYGAKRPLADIDIDLNQKNYSKIVKEVKPFITFGPKHYKDKNWDLELMTLDYQGQLIDLGGIVHAKIFDSQKRKWFVLKDNFSKKHLRKIYGIKTPVQNKKELVLEKKKLGRNVDREDLNQIEKPKPTRPRLLSS